MYYLLTKLASLDLSPLPKAGLDGTTSSLQTILSLFFAIAGAVAVLIITLAGFKYVLSRGESDAVAKAKNTIIYAVVGLAVCVVAELVVQFVIRST